MWALKIFWGKILLCLRVFYYILGTLLMLAPFIVVFILYRMTIDINFKSFILSGWYPFNYFGDTIKVIFYGGCLFFIGMLECLFGKFVFFTYKQLKGSKEAALDESRNIIKYDSFGEVDQDLTKLSKICKIKSYISVNNHKFFHKNR